MPPDPENPYERWDIDPLGGAAAITERMRELIEDAKDDAERAAIRAAWEELTLHPARRLRAALGAHPSAHGAASRPPRPSPMSRERMVLDLGDLAMRPSILSALGSEAEPSLPDVSLDSDPVLQER
jgi:hypothetical protein